MKNNIIINYIGNGYPAALSIILLPIYINMLGLEYFGLLSLFAIIQSFIVLFEFGSRQTIIKIRSEIKNEFFNYIHTIHLQALLIAVIIFITLFLSKNYIIYSWININGISYSTVEKVFIILSTNAAVKYLEGFYSSIIIGFDNQIAFNIINILITTLRGLCNILILFYITDDILEFSFFQLIFTIISSVLSFIYIKKIILIKKYNYNFSLITKHFNFMLGITLTSSITICLVNVDKLILAKFLTISEFGYYMIANTFAGLISVLFLPINQSFYPKFCKSVNVNDIISENLYLKYGIFLITLIPGSITLFIILNSFNILLFWTNNIDVSKNSFFILSLLSLSCFLNGLLSFFYSIKLSHGFSSLMIKYSVLLLILSSALNILLIPFFSFITPALISMLNNIILLLISFYMFFKKIKYLNINKTIFKYMIFPLTITFLINIIFRYFLNIYFSDLISVILSFILIFVSIYLLIPKSKDILMNLLSLK